MDHRKALGERLAHLGIAVLRRKRRAAWSKWVEETRLWMEEQHLVRFRNRPTELVLRPCHHKFLFRTPPERGAVVANCSLARCCR